MHFINILLFASLLVGLFPRISSGAEFSGMLGYRARVVSGRGLQRHINYELSAEGGALRVSLENPGGAYWMTDGACGGVVAEPGAFRVPIISEASVMLGKMRYGIIKIPKNLSGTVSTQFILNRETINPVSGYGLIQSLPGAMYHGDRASGGIHIYGNPAGASGDSGSFLFNGSIDLGLAVFDMSGGLMVENTEKSHVSLGISSSLRDYNVSTGAGVSYDGRKSIIMSLQRQIKTAFGVIYLRGSANHSPWKTAKGEHTADIDVHIKSLFDNFVLRPRVRAFVYSGGESKNLFMASIMATYFLRSN